jgi:predicted enzyme related to lactoylglutathione lyase
MRIHDRLTGRDSSDSPVAAQGRAIDRLCLQAEDVLPSDRETVMAEIRHIAIFSDHPKKLAEFYGEVFGTSVTGVDDLGNAWITDGTMNIALLARRERANRRPGIHHWGFTVEEADKPAIVAKMRSYGIEPYSPYVDSPEAHRPYAEDAVKDPDGNRFDLSTGMRAVRTAEAGGGKTSRPDDDRPAPATVRHIAIFSDDPGKLSKFYVDVFGLKITGESQGDVWVTDGYVDVALISRKSAKAPRGIHHWGFTLAAEAKPKIYEELAARGLPVKDPRAEDPTIDRPYVEHAGFDIDGNRYDLTTGKRDMDAEKARTRQRLGALPPAK